MAYVLWKVLQILDYYTSCRVKRHRDAPTASTSTVYMRVLFVFELQRNPRAICRSHRQTQLLLPRFIVSSTQTLYLLHQTNRHIRRCIDGKLVAQAHSRTSQERYVSPIGWRVSLPALGIEGFSIRAPVVFVAMETVQWDQNCCALGDGNRRFSIGTAAGWKGGISGCGTKTPWYGWVAA